MKQSGIIKGENRVIRLQPIEKSEMRGKYGVNSKNEKIQPADSQQIGLF